MKKLIGGLLAVGGVIALRPILKRVRQKMREHCEQMMAQFAGRSEATSHEAIGPEAMRERCAQVTTRRKEPGEPVATA